jgi:hypothetical protein
MKRIAVSLLLVLVLVASIAAVAQEKESAKVKALKTAGNEVVTMLVNENFAGVSEKFTSEMKKAAPTDKLEAQWQSLTSQAGPFEKVLSTEVKEGKKNSLVVLKCKFEKVALYLHVAFNTENRISNLDILDK